MQHTSERILAGKYKGQRWTRVPKTYLEFLANNAEDLFLAVKAKEELERRGTDTPRLVEISGHAIDRASQITEKSDWGEKGLFTWLTHMAEEALVEAKGADRVEYKDITFCFKYGNYQPVLTTIFKAKDICFTH